jgi:Flp pilus assembly protein CpaB
VLSRWSRPSRRYLVAGLALALVGLLSMRTYLSREARAAGAGGSPVPVVVASADIDRGAALRPEDLRTVSIPRAYAPPGALRTVDQAAGRVALADLAEGEAVTRTRLARVRAGPVASLIPAGLRAFAVPTSLPTGTVAPGDLIDVLATYSTGQPHTETVVSGVEVLFVLGTGWGGAPGRSGGAGGGGGSAFDAAAAGAAASGTLILLVSAEQDERLAYARAFADLSIAVEPAAKLPGRMG